MLNEVKLWVSEEMIYILLMTRYEVVDSKDFVAFFNESITEM